MIRESEEFSMKCPYCEREMEQGVIQSPHEISWKKGVKRRLLGRASLHEGSVVLSELSFFRGSGVIAWLCRDCGKIVIDVSDEKSDLNHGQIPIL